MLSFYLSVIAIGLLVGEISAFSVVGQAAHHISTGLFSSPCDFSTAKDSFSDNTGKITSNNASYSRRQVFDRSVTASMGVAAPILLPMRTNAAAEQRCDAVDPRCGADGILRDVTPKGKPIPRVTNKITHVVQLVIDVGERREEVGFIRFGLYGDDCPKTVRTMLEFLTPVGITGAVSERKDDFLDIDVKTVTVSILEGGIVPEICPGKGIEFGVPSQRKAYARARGLREAGSNFLPQNRPEAVSLESEPSARKHDVAGLISIPEKGIGYASGGDVDGAYSNAFLITADANSDFDAKLRRRVIGQIIDDESMEFLARLSSLPIQKKSSGSKGPPLLKITVLDTGVQKVGASSQQKGGKKK